MKNSMTSLFCSIIFLFVAFCNIQGKDKGLESDSYQTAQQVQRIKTWNFKCNNKEMGYSSDYFGPYSNLLVHNRKVYFVDDVLQRVNCIDLNHGIVIWGNKKSLQHSVEHIAYFANHLVLLSQFGVQTFDSLLKHWNFIPFHQNFFPNVIVSLTEYSIVALSTFQEFNDTGTGQRFYSKYLTMDTLFKFNESINFLGQTSHLDARNPPYSDSVYRWSRYIEEHMNGGKPFEIQVVKSDTCISSGKHLLQMPRQISFSDIKYSVAFDSDLLAFWKTDSTGRVYTITIYDYAKK